MIEKIAAVSIPELKEIIRDTIRDEFKRKNRSTATYSINQTAKMLRMSHSTVKKLIKNGSIYTTADNRRIPAAAIEEYLKNIKIEK